LKTGIDSPEGPQNQLHDNSRSIEEEKSKCFHEFQKYIQILQRLTDFHFTFHKRDRMREAETGD
jgi:hypothetical protein